MQLFVAALIAALTAGVSSRSSSAKLAPKSATLIRRAAGCGGSPRGSSTAAMAGNAAVRTMSVVAKDGTFLVMAHRQQTRGSLPHFVQQHFRPAPLVAQLGCQDEFHHFEAFRRIDGARPVWKNSAIALRQVELVSAIRCAGRRAARPGTEVAAGSRGQRVAGDVERTSHLAVRPGKRPRQVEPAGLSSSRYRT